MAERDKTATRPADWPASQRTLRNGPGNDLERLDDAQVTELVSNAYWTLLERFVCPDGGGTNIPSATGAG